MSISIIYGAEIGFLMFYVAMGPFVCTWRNKIPDSIFGGPPNTGVLAKIRNEILQNKQTTREGADTRSAPNVY